MTRAPRGRVDIDTAGGGPSGPPGAVGGYRRALARVTAGLGLPFGYTVTVWASGALAVHAFGAPGPLEIGAFVAGAVSAYLLLGVVEYTEIEPVQALRTRRVVLFNAVPVIAASLVALVDRVVDGGALGFFLSASVATAGYVLILAGLWAWDDARAPGRTDGPR